MLFKQSTNTETKAPKTAFFMVTLLLVYTAVQHALFSNGYTGFSTIFHTADSIINSFLMPSLFFLTAFLFKEIKANKTEVTPIELFINHFVYVFIVWIFVQNILEVFFSGYTGSNALISDIYFDFTSLPSNHLWLIIALLVNLLLLNFIDKFNSLVSFAVIALISIIAYLYQDLIPNVYPFNYLQEYFIFTFAGKVYYKKCRDFKLKGKSVIFGIILFIICQYLFHGVFLLQSYSQSLITLVLAFVGVAFVLSVSQLFSSILSASFNFCLASVFIYLFHFLIAGGVRIFLERTLNYTYIYGHLFIGIATAILIPLIIYRLRRSFFIVYLYSPPKVLSYAFLTQFYRDKLSNLYLLRKFLYVSMSGIFVFYSWIYIKSEVVLNSLSKIPVTELTAADESVLTLAEGKRLASIYGCYMGCHGSNLEGIEYHKTPFIGIYNSPNLTISVDKYNDSELAMMIREGLRPNGQPLISGMPSAGYSAMPDNHLSSILAFLRSQPKIKKPTVKPSIGISTRYDIAFDKFQYQHIMAESILTKIKSKNISSGERWVMSSCTECHGVDLKGKSELGSPSLVIVRAYSYDEFKVLLQKGKNLSGKKMGLMTLVSKVRFSKFSEKELKEMYEYLNMLVL